MHMGIHIYTYTFAVLRAVRRLSRAVLVRSVNNVFTAGCGRYRACACVYYGKRRPRRVFLIVFVSVSGLRRFRPRSGRSPVGDSGYRRRDGPGLWSVNGQKKKKLKDHP